MLSGRVTICVLSLWTVVLSEEALKTLDHAVTEAATTETDIVPLTSARTNISQNPIKALAPFDWGSVFDKLFNNLIPDGESKKPKMTLTEIHLGPQNMSPFGIPERSLADPFDLFGPMPWHRQPAAMPNKKQVTMTEIHVGPKLSPLSADHSLSDPFDFLGPLFNTFDDDSSLLMKPKKPQLKLAEIHIRPHHLTHHHHHRRHGTLPEDESSYSAYHFDRTKMKQDDLIDEISPEKTQSDIDLIDQVADSKTTDEEYVCPLLRYLPYIEGAMAGISIVLIISLLITWRTKRPTALWATVPYTDDKSFTEKV